MAKLFGNGKFSDFADRKQLAADKTKFCMESAKLVRQNDGKERWYCTIFLQGEGELEVKTLTFDRSPSRDAGFEELNASGSFPVHACWLDKREFKGKSSGMMQTFYELNFEDNALSCPCGDIGKVVEPAPDLANVPF